MSGALRSEIPRLLPGAGVPFKPRNDGREGGQTYFRRVHECVLDELRLDRVGLDATGAGQLPGSLCSSHVLLHQ